MAEKRRDSKGRVLWNGESQRKDGMYMYRYTDSFGIRRAIYSWKLVDTDKLPSGKRDCDSLRKAEDDLKHDLLDGLKVGKKNYMSINDIFYSVFINRKDLKESTIVGYHTLYEKHVKNEIGHMAVGDVKFSTIFKLYVSICSDKGLKFSTVESLNSCMVQIFEFAVNDDIIRTNPCPAAIKEARKQINKEEIKRKEALTKEQQERFVKFVRSNPKHKAIGFLITVLLGTGLRIGEALGLRWDDCDLENRIIHVTHELVYKEDLSGKYSYRLSTPKTKASIRDIPMLDDVYEEFAREKAERSKKKSDFEVAGYTNFIFLNSSGKVFTQNGVYAIISRAAKSYNEYEKKTAVSEDRKPCLINHISPHIFRHTFSTRAYEAGMDWKLIQSAMGHAKIDTTMDTYTDVTLEKKREEFKKIDGAFTIT